MASATGVDAQGLREAFKPDAALTVSQDRIDSTEVGDRENHDNVSPEVLEHGIEAIEGKKSAWYAYLTTRDFWLVLTIGYVSFLFSYNYPVRSYLDKQD